MENDEVVPYFLSLLFILLSEVSEVGEISGRRLPEIGQSSNSLDEDQANEIHCCQRTKQYVVVLYLQQKLHNLTGPSCCGCQYWSHFIISCCVRLANTTVTHINATGTQDNDNIQFLREVTHFNKTERSCDFSD